MSVTRLRLRPLTPIHVGTGEVLEPYQYALTSEGVRVLSLPRLIETLPEIDRERYLEAMAGGPFSARDEVQNLLRGRLDLDAVTAWRARAHEGFRQYLSGRLDKNQARLEVRTLPRALDGAYLPGSSLKGAIRTALLSDRLETKFLNAEHGHRDLTYNHTRGWQPQVTTGDQGYVRLPRKKHNKDRGLWLKASQLLEAHVLGYETTGNGDNPDAKIDADPMRTVAVTDSTPLPTTSFAKLEVWGSRPKPRQPEKRTGITLLAETWDDGAVEVTLRIDRAFQEKNRYNMVFTPDLFEIAAAAHERYHALAADELEVYEERGWERAAEAMDVVLDEIEACLEANGSRKHPYRFPLRLGFGTGDLTLRLAEHLHPAPNPISRTLAEELPMGWLLAEVVEEQNP